MTDDRLDRWLEVVRLKALDRAGWLRVGVRRPESVAAHSWGVAWLVLELLPAELDLGRALAYAVLHDLPEARVGDLTPHDGVDATTKHALEADAARALLPPALHARWEAYEAQVDPEARFVKQLDRLDMALQALAYAEETGGERHDVTGSSGPGGHRPADDRNAADLGAFLVSARKAMVDPELVALLDALEGRL